MLLMPTLALGPVPSALPLLPYPPHPDVPPLRPPAPPTPVPPAPPLAAAPPLLTPPAPPPPPITEPPPNPKFGPVWPHAANGLAARRAVSRILSNKLPRIEFSLNSRLV